MTDRRLYPPLDRPPVWVTIRGVRYPGRVHARVGGRVHVEYTAGVGQQRLVWVAAGQVEARGDDTA